MTMNTVTVEDSNLLLSYAVFINEHLPTFRNFLEHFSPGSSCPRIFTLFLAAWHWRGKPLLWEPHMYTIRLRLDGQLYCAIIIAQYYWPSRSNNEGMPNVLNSLWTVLLTIHSFAIRLSISKHVSSTIIPVDWDVNFTNFRPSTLFPVAK
jgi:hypothetical protein